MLRARGSTPPPGGARAPARLVPAYHLRQRVLRDLPHGQDLRPIRRPLPQPLLRVVHRDRRPRRSRDRAHDLDARLGQKVRQADRDDRVRRDTVSGLHSVLRLPWSEEYQVAMLGMYHKVFDSIKAMAGEHVWNFADFETSVGTGRVDGDKKGVFTRDRRPKAAAHALRERWTKLKKK
ncbi:hypothetical protein VC83_00468 [Pseudogymnoascus destructans]|nr:uncharacterized protein VC83_00468 [Pseudogymnoascus destructans]OAF63422.1 hypothetical protein VC83_00468 [Pseudogymnoascus destructans]